MCLDADEDSKEKLQLYLSGLFLLHHHAPLHRKDQRSIARVNPKSTRSLRANIVKSILPLILILLPLLRILNEIENEERNINLLHRKERVHLNLFGLLHLKMNG